VSSIWEGEAPAEPRMEEMSAKPARQEPRPPFRRFKNGIRRLILRGTLCRSATTVPRIPLPGSRDDVVSHFAVDVGQAEVASAVAVYESFVIQTEQVKHRCMQIVQMHLVFDRLVAQFVGCPIS